MNKIRLLTKWISAIVVIAILGQMLLLPVAPLYASGPARPMVQAADPGSQAQTVHMKKLVQALEAYEASGGDAAALEDVQRAWAAVEQSSQRTQAGLQAPPPLMNASAQGVAEARLDSLTVEEQQGLTQFQGQYQTFFDAAQADPAQSLDEAAALRASLEQSLEDAAKVGPQLDLLPNRPAPAAAPVGELPALYPDSTASEQETTTGDQPFTTFTGPTILSMHDGEAPSPADLLPTEDAAFEPEIEALAAELNYDPTAIYAYVRNHISFEPYYGSHKGALLTLWERSGNDVDTASLLIALLRASGFYARYVEGTVAVDAAAAQNWVGNAPDLATAGSILATGGVPVALSADGYLVKEHVWVEVYDPERLSYDFNFNGSVDVGDIESVAAALGSANRFYDRDRDGLVDRDDLDLVAGRWKQADPGLVWVSLDASFKQYTFYETPDLSAITGFSATEYISSVANASSVVVSDTLQSIVGMPDLPSLDFPDDPDLDVPFADLVLQQAVSATVDYINANPNLTNADLLGGAYIITETVTTLPADLPLLVVDTQPVTTYSELPDSSRDKLTVTLLDEFGGTQFSYQESFPALANKRVTISYEAATPADQAIIDSYGGTLLTTPPIVDLQPVLRINGAEVARGPAVGMGEGQIRRLTFTDANGASSSVQNGLSAGDTIAVGLAYGRTSAEAIEASQARLAAARDALPQTPEGLPDGHAPENMAEPIIGEMLHLALQAYFSQLDTFSELTARDKHVRWFRYLSGGVATQSLVFGYGFLGNPVATYGGGMGFDIQQNVVAAISLRGNAADSRSFMQTSGYLGSALEHSIWENAGQGAVSSIRLLSLALEQGIPVYRIDSSNRADVLPRLQLSAAVESDITNALNQGKIVTVSEREMQVNDWSGVGYIILDPASGAAGYMISGGLNGMVGTVNGGSLWDILTTIAAYAWLAINFGLDLFGVVAGIGLLLVPEPTFITKALGIALIVGNLVALGFDVSDLQGLISGDLSAQQYIADQITGLILEAILRRVGLAALGRLLDELGPGQAARIVDSADDLVNGAADSLRLRGFSDVEIIRMSELGLTSESALRSVDDLANRFGLDDVRSLLNNDFINSRGAFEAVMEAALDAPVAPGLEDTLSRALSRSDFGYAYELRRAAAHAGDNVTAYGQRIDVSFERITSFDASGNPIRSGNLEIQPLEGDIVLNGSDFIDAKHGSVGNQDLRIWNQIVKAQAAIDAGQISSFTFEASSSVGANMRAWAAINAPDVVFRYNLGDGFLP